MDASQIWSYLDLHVVATLLTIVLVNLVYYAFQRRSKGEENVFLVTTYNENAILAHTPKGEKGKGLYAFRLNENRASLEPLASSALSPNPAFLLKHPQSKTENPTTVYATTESITVPGEILKLSINTKSGAGKVISRTQAGGKSTCYLNINKDATLLQAVNYWDSKLTLFPLSQTGDVEECCDVAGPDTSYVEQNNPDREEHWRYRQRWAHTHCAVTAPHYAEFSGDAQEYRFVCDLGRDMMLVYGVSEDRLILLCEIQLKQGLGPRHIVFHPTMPVAYVINELSNTISSFRYNQEHLRSVFDNQLPMRSENCTDEKSTLFHLQTLSTLPEDFEDKGSIIKGVWKAGSHAAEIRLHPKGKFVCIANRGHDSIAVFSIDANDGYISMVGTFASGGKTPRNFNFSPTGNYVLVGNQDSNNVTLFSMDQEKGILEAKQSLRCPSPNYIMSL